MKVTVNIYRIEDRTKIASFETSATDIRKAFYNYVSKRYSELKVSATECYFKLTDN